MDASRLSLHFIQANALLALGLVIWKLFDRPLDGEISISRLRFAKLIFITTLLASALFFYIPVHTFISPQIEIWPSKSFKSNSSTLHSEQIVLTKFASSTSIKSWPNPSFFQAISLLLVFSCAIFNLIKLFLHFKKLSQILNTSFTLKKIGKVRVLSNDVITVPFSFWSPRHAFVVLKVQGRGLRIWRGAR